MVTAPDRPKGRGMNLQPSPVKAAAQAEGIAVLQPPTLRSVEAQQALHELHADLFAVVAYGLILPPAVLDTPPLGCINVHFSLLPAFRGAAPVQWAIAEGHTETGVAIMRMDPGLDTGPVLRMVREPIQPEDTSGSLAERLASVGAEVLVAVIDRLAELEAVPQPESGASYASKITPEDAHVDWGLPAQTIASRVRAFNPRPGAWGKLNSRRLKILSTKLCDEVTEFAAGTLIVGSDGGLQVQTGSTLLSLELIQPEGKSSMDARSFSRGNRLTSGDRFS